MSEHDEPSESHDPPDDVRDGPGDDADDGSAEQSNHDSPAPRPWQLPPLPGFDSYLRNVIGPLSKELDSINRIADAVRVALPRFDVPMVDFPIPEIRIAPELSRSLIDIDAALSPIREAVASMLDWSQLARALIDPKIIERIRESVARHMPPNWSGLDGWLDAATFIDETGWPIVWLPRAEAVIALLHADIADREAILLSLIQTIAEDAIHCAAEVKHDDLRFVADCITEVAESIKSGRTRAAQALAASVLTELIQGILGHDELADARREYAESWEEKSIQVMRFALVTSAIPKALTRFYRQKGDPIPQRFNRHAVAHGASPIQFTPTNAVVSLILITALARELQALYDEDVLRDEED